MKFLRVLLLTPLFILGLLFVVLAVVIIWPKILINDTTVRWAAKWADQKGIHLSWKSLDIDIESPTLLKKRFNLTAQNLCVNLEDPKLSTCSEDFQFSFAVRFTGFRPSISELGPLEIHQASWKFGEGKDLIYGDLNLESGKESESELRSHGNWNFRALRLSGSANLPDHSRIVTQAMINLKGIPEKDLHVTYFMDTRYDKGKANLQSHLEGGFDPDRWYGKISATGKRLIPTVPEIVLKECDWSLERLGQKDILSKEGQFQLNCPLEAHVPMPPESIRRFEVPTQLGARVSMNLRTSSFPPKWDGRIKGSTLVQIDPILAPLFRGEGYVSADVEGRLSDFPLNGKIQSTLGIKVQVPKFEKLVSHLEPTDWAVPAPANVLKGLLSIDIDGTSDLWSGQFPLHIVTRLNSKTQILDLDGNGVLQVEGLRTGLQPNFRFDLTLSDVQLELPRLNWAAPPPVIPDPRFRSTQVHASKKKGSIPFHYQITLQTPIGHPIRVRSNLAQETIPVNLSLVLSDSAPMKGSIRVESFKIEFMRRQAKVQYFDLDLSSPMNESPIEGLVQMDYVDYKMSIAILSTLGKPRIRLRSDPPLPENQLVAALVFGKPLEELEPDQNASVGNTRAAFASGAIGLVSFYALASTPVQSVDYDSLTGRFSAKIRLGEGMSLNVGATADADATDVGVRKRLSQFWTIETNLGSSSAGTGQVASAYLEWSHRY